MRRYLYIVMLCGILAGCLGPVILGPEVDTALYGVWSNEDELWIFTGPGYDPQKGGFSWSNDARGLEYVGTWRAKNRILYLTVLEVRQGRVYWHVQNPKEEDYYYRIEGDILTIGEGTYHRGQDG